MIDWARAGRRLRFSHRSRDGRGRAATEIAIMTASSTDTRYDLARSQIINLRMPAGATIACSSGLVWITQAGHPDDYWVPAGDRVAFAPGARVVIEAAQ